MTVISTSTSSGRLTLQRSYGSSIVFMATFGGPDCGPAPIPAQASGRSGVSDMLNPDVGLAINDIGGKKPAVGPLKRLCACFGSTHRRHLHVFDELLKYLARTLAEAHLLVCHGVFAGAVNTGGGVFAATVAVRLERQRSSEDLRSGTRFERPATRTGCGGPDVLAVWHDLQVARLRGQLSSVGVNRLSEELAARLQVDFARDGSVGFRAEPRHQVLRRCPGLEHQRWRHVYDALRHQAPFIFQCRRRSPSSRVDRHPIAPDDAPRAGAGRVRTVPL